MKDEWKRISSDDGRLMYEGFTFGGKPHGAGTTYYENGNKYQEGVFDAKGLAYGREYYPNGNVRFEGAYSIQKGFGPNYPVFGTCYDEKGNEYFYGELTVRKNHAGFPKVIKPEGFGPVVLKESPDLKVFFGDANEIGSAYICYVRPRGRKVREEFLEFLEKNGFVCEEQEEFGREFMTGSRLPIKIDFGNKVYSPVNSMIHSTLIATTNRMFTIGEFCMFFELWSSLIIV